MRSTRIAVLLACCAFLFACKTAEDSGATSVDPAACRMTCDSAYDTCANSCAQKVDNNMCSTECIDTLQHCKKRCG